MGAFKQTYKLVHETNITGATSSITVDGIFQTGKSYFITGDSFYYQTTGTHMVLYLRSAQANNTDASYQRGSQTAQHSQSSLLVGRNNASANGGTIIYVGNSEVESGGFKFYFNSNAYSQTDSYWFDGIGHVDGTGYRGTTQYSTKLQIAKFDGFQIAFNGFSALTGNLKIYEINLNESEYLKNV